jgi:moderate conductance mechanosensitive channel
MIDQIVVAFTGPAWWSYLLRIIGIYLLAWAVHKASGYIADHVVRLNSHHPSQERNATLRSIIASAITVFAYAIATIVVIAQFVDTTTLVWVVGLLSAGFGLGARPIISDFLSGFSLIFEDTFAVGEKIEIMGIEGVVEEVNLRTTLLRASSGEFYTIPNGEIRVIRNFSRGRFSQTIVNLKVVASDLERSLTLLDELGVEAVVLLPNLLEPWQVISTSGVIGKHTELTLLAKARFGKAAEMQPRILALVHERLGMAGIPLED